MISSWCATFLPGKSGLPSSTSAKMHPSDLRGAGGGEGAQSSVRRRRLGTGGEGGAWGGTAQPPSRAHTVVVAAPKTRPTLPACTTLPAPQASGPPRAAHQMSTAGVYLA